MNTYLTQKELPASERPYEKCERFGPEVLSDAELLAVIIRSGSKTERAVDLAVRILNFPGQKHGLSGLHYFSLQELTKIKGIGKVKATQILCAVELSKRISVASNESKEEFSSPQQIARCYMEKLRYGRTEEIVLLMLDTKLRRIADEVISKGTVNSAIIEPREVLSCALRHDAVFIVLLHNHPSGVAVPSEADIEATLRIQNACKIIGIELKDHIIIGDHCYLSMMEYGILKN